MSKTDLVKAPEVEIFEILYDFLPDWYLGTLPCEGFNPYIPVNPAGIRIDPQPSPPVANGINPDATATAEPPLEPPEVQL